MADEEYEADDAGAEYDDIAEEDDNIEETEEQEEDPYGTQCVPAGQAGGGVEKSKRITTKYMTKYERARVLGKAESVVTSILLVFYALFIHYKSYPNIRRWLLNSRYFNWIAKF